MMLRPIALTLALLLGSAAGHAWAQSAQPFDMSGEDVGGQSTMPAVPAAPSAYPAPLQMQPPAAAAPLAPDTVPGIPMTVPSIRQGGNAAPMGAAPTAGDSALPPAVSAVPAAPAKAEPSVPPPAISNSAAGEAGQASPSESSRYIIPAPNLRLEGENDQEAWTIFLTARQAERAVRLNVSYKNAIVVMPEVSRLRVSFNGQVILEEPLASSDNFRSVSAEIPASVLQAGTNLLRFQALQRHRTDCSVQSTYELWTDIDPAGTTLAFSGADTAGTIEALEDLPALGYDATGRTILHFIAPRAGDSAVAASIIGLSQSLGLYGQFPNPSAMVSESSSQSDGAGTLTVVLGPAGALDGMLGETSIAAATSPVVSFVTKPDLGATVLAITGSGWSQVQAAVDAIADKIDRPLDVTRSVLGTSAWFAPDVHFFTGPESVSFAKLGVASQQFSGRRFRVEFGVGIPSDFYAEAYGEASILLDAAYTPEVLPASHIDIYVNGQIAATTRIVNKTGGIFRHFPIQVPFRAFRPGVNRIAIEAVLDTDADRACGPGGSAAGTDRFALFDSSEFSMPQFARIARRPNLAAFAGTGFPYNRQHAPSALVLGRSSTQTVSAASTLMARLAMQAGRIVPVALSSMANVGDRPAIFVGSTAQISVDVLARLGIASDARTAWKPDTIRSSLPGGTAAATSAPSDTEDTDALFSRWRNQLSDGGGWRGQVSGFEDWMKRTFDISFSAFRFGPAAAVAFRPPVKASLLLAQGSSPTGSSAWTLITAPDDEQLASATRSVVGIENWSEVGGQFSTYNASTGKVTYVAPLEVTFVVTQPLSLQNARLIAANWLSSNIMFYAIGLITVCILLGVATSVLLHRLGRPS
jgi:hypothetical protein